MKNNMANKILIIGVGSAGVIAADKIELPNSKKLLIDTSYREVKELETESDKLLLQCKDFGECSGFCHCYNRPDFCRSVANDYENEIREYIKDAFIKEQ